MAFDFKLNIYSCILHTSGSPLTGEHVRSGDDVLAGLISVVGDTGVVSSVGARERDKVAGGSATAASDLELVASGVELSTGVLVGGVESDGFVADEVVTGLDAGRDGVLDGLAVNNGILTLLVNVRCNGMSGKTYGGPVFGASLPTIFLNLEPNSILARLVVLATSIRALGHVGHDGTHVSLRPQSPVESDGRASGGRSVQRGRLAARRSTSGIAVALDVDAGDILNRAVSGNHARDALWLGVHVGVGVGVVELVLLAPDDGALDVAVGSRDGGGRKEGGNTAHLGLKKC